MYLAKSRGKNNFQFFTPDLAQRAERHFAMESDLRQAVEENQLVLHYQPVFRAADGRLVVVGQPEAPFVHGDRHDHG